jgi:hypothetical protein
MRFQIDREEFPDQGRFQFDRDDMQWPEDREELRRLPIDDFTPEEMEAVERLAGPGRTVSWQTALAVYLESGHNERLAGARLRSLVELNDH